MKSLWCSLLLSSSWAIAAPALQDTTPSVHAVYEAERAGHVAEAQQLIDQVLAEHPDSGKAHYVAAEVYAQSGNLERARREFARTRALEPAMKFAGTSSVATLQRTLFRPEPPAGARHSFLWWEVLAIAAVCVFVWINRRRRWSAAALGPQPVSRSVLAPRPADDSVRP